MEKAYHNNDSHEVSIQQEVNSKTSGNILMVLGKYSFLDSTAWENIEIQKNKEEMYQIMLDEAKKWHITFDSQWNITETFAPNGQKSLLYESLTKRFGLTQEIALQSYLQVRTKKFIQRFGDRTKPKAGKTSVFVDKNGEPMPLYHGSNHNFDFFDENKIWNTDYGYYGKGYYLSTSPGISAYGDKEMIFYAKLDNPFYFTEEKESERKYYAALLNKNLSKKETVLGAISLLQEQIHMDQQQLTERKNDTFTKHKDIPPWSDFDTYRANKKIQNIARLEKLIKKNQTLISTTEITYDNLQQHDGVVANHNIEATRNNGYTEIIIFDQKAVKSATNNNGNFWDTKKFNE